MSEATTFGRQALAPSDRLAYYARTKTARALVALVIGTEQTTLSPARAAPLLEAPALRRCRREPNPLVRRDQRGAPRWACDAWPRAAYGASAGDGNRQPVRRRSEDRRHASPGLDDDLARRPPGAARAPADELGTRSRRCAQLERRARIPGGRAALRCSAARDVRGDGARSRDGERERHLAVELNQPRRILRVEPRSRVPVVVVPSRIEREPVIGVSSPNGYIMSSGLSQVCPSSGSETVVRRAARDRPERVQELVRGGGVPRNARACLHVDDREPEAGRVASSLAADVGLHRPVVVHEVLGVAGAESAHHQRGGDRTETGIDRGELRARLRQPEQGQIELRAARERARDRSGASGAGSCPRHQASIDSASVCIRLP